MSQIRSGMPAPLPAPSSPISPALSPARLELMRLMGLTAPQPAAQPAVPAVQTAAASAAPRADALRPDPNGDRPTRPGSLLDIRV